MQINNIHSNQNFKAIHLKNSDFKEIRDASLFLDINGFNCLGFNKVYVSKENKKGIREAVKFQRENYLDSTSAEFGVVVFPWSKEGYLISTPADEQKMYALLQNFTQKAKIDFLL